MMLKNALQFFLVSASLSSVTADKGSLKGKASTGIRRAQTNLLGLGDVLGTVTDFNNALSLAGLPTGNLVCDTLQGATGILDGGSVLCTADPITSTNLGGCLSSLIPGISISSSDGGGLKVEVLNGNAVLETVNSNAGIVVNVADAAAVSVDVPVVNSLLGGLVNPTQVLNVLGTDGSVLGNLPLGLDSATNFFGIVSPTDAIGSLLLQSTGNQGLLNGILGPVLGLTQTLDQICFVPKPPAPGPVPGPAPTPTGTTPTRPTGPSNPTGTQPAPTGTGNPPSGGSGAGPTGSCVTGLLQCSVSSDCCSGLVCRKKGMGKKKLCRTCKKARKFCADSSSCCPGLRCVKNKCAAS